MWNFEDNYEISYLISQKKHTVMCLNIGTPINNKFLFVPNGKLILFRYIKI